MKREIKKHHLDFEKTIAYFIDHIECEKTLSQKIVKKTNFHEGNFYTYLPANAVINRLYIFSCGGIIPPIPYGTRSYKIEGVSEHFHPQQIITMDKECSEIISTYTKKEEQNYAVIENYMFKPENPLAHIKNVKMIPYEKEVYYFLDKNNSLEEINKTIRRSNEVWHSLFVLTHLDLPVALDDEIMDKICENTKFIITGAYDGESYIFWEKNETVI